MNHAFRLIKLIFLVASILLCLAIPVVGLVSTARGWEGICYGITDGQHPCPWWEYAGVEMFWASFLFIPLLFGAAVFWLGIAVIQFVIAQMRKRKQKLEIQTGDERG